MTARMFQEPTVFGGTEKGYEPNPEGSNDARLDRAPGPPGACYKPRVADRSLIEDLRERVRARPLPRHVAIIMDGNGRWAEARGLPRVAGHREGSEAVRAVTRAARRVGVGALTLYAFSSENWGRPEEEVGALMQLLAEYLDSERGEMMDNAIRLNAIGDLERLPAFVRE